MLTFRDIMEVEMTIARVRRPSASGAQLDDVAEMTKEMMWSLPQKKRAIMKDPIKTSHAPAFYSEGSY